MKTFIQLLDTIKAECRIKASDNLDEWVKDVINQELRTLCANAEYPELLVPFATVAITSDAQSLFALPVGVRQIVAVEYAQDGVDPHWRPLSLRNSYIVSMVSGTPNWYFRAGNNLYVFPYSLITTTHALRISYYKTVTSLVADGDLIEVPDLEEPLIQRVIARVLRYHKDRGDAQATAVDAVGAETRVVQ